MTLVVRRSRAVLIAFVLVALAATWLVVGAAKSSQALNGKVLILDTTLASSASINEQTQAATLGLGADVVTPEQWAAMTTADFAQYDAVVLADDECAESDAADVLAAPLANLATWVPAVAGNIFFSTSDAVYHANNGNNESGATLQITKGLAFSAGAGVTGLYFTSSCYGDDAWLGILDAFSPGWTANGNSANNIHVTGSAALLMGLDDANLVNYSSTVHHQMLSWASDFTVYAIATDQISVTQRVRRTVATRLRRSRSMVHTTLRTARRAHPSSSSGVPTRRRATSCCRTTRPTRWARPHICSPP